ncbi:MAG: RpoL/Rpb11 RNA polymerase subunit family protein [Nitrososphaerota archaeon]
MEVKIVEKGERVLELEFRDVDFSIIDSLQEVLISYNEVEYAGANLTHPLLGVIRFILKTREGYNALEVLQRGLSELSTLARALREAVQQSLT